METDLMTTDDAEAPPAASPAPGGSTDPGSSDAESILNNLLQVVRKRADEILDTARAEAEAEFAATRARMSAERDDVLAAARREADDVMEKAQRSAAEQSASVLAVVEATIAELSRIEEYRGRLEALAAQLRGVVNNVRDYDEVDPEALQMLAGELGERACREVIDTFVTELTSQLDNLTAAVESDDVKSKKVSRILHNLSSGCATVGAADLARLCHQVTPDTLMENLDELVQRGKSVLDEVVRIRDGELSDGEGASLGDDAP